MNTKFFATIVVAVFFAFIFIACGGEDGPDPVDDTGVTDDAVITDENEIPDSDIQEPDNVQTDDIQDNAPSDDDSILTDEENPDGDQVLVADCSKLLDIVGDWVSINVEGYAITVTVEPRETDCRVAVKWTQGFNGTQEWFGLELPLTLWDEESYEYMTLKKTGENLVREETAKSGEFLMETVFKKIQ